MAATCFRCKQRVQANQARCANCGAWQTGASKHVSTSRLSDVPIEQVERIVTGSWDVCWGGGIVPTSVTMLGGQPGAGKSTFLLQLASAIATVSKKSIAYIGTEEAPGEIKSRADRLQVTLQDDIFMISALDEPSEAIRELDELLEAEDIGLIILDSLQGLTSGDFSASLETLKMLKSRCTKNTCPGIVISHINKSGDYAGLMTFQHAVDCLLVLETDEATGKRTLTARKNRNGPAPIELGFTMTEHGLLPD